MSYTNAALRLCTCVLTASLYVPAAVTITPGAPPAVEPGQTIRFTANVPVQWSVAPGSRGTIDAEGTYHAPATVKAKHSAGACQMMPNNHVFNTRIDQLPVHPSSYTWMTAAAAGTPNYIGSINLNQMSASTPRRNLTFVYTPLNNGAFAIPPLPDVAMQSGWYTEPLASNDRHLFSIDPQTCAVEEIYDLFAAGSSTSCATCTSVSGVKYSGSSYALAVNGGTDAASLYNVPLSLHYQEVMNALATGGSIQHALRFTLRAPADYKTGWLWPAKASAFYGAGDRMKMGSRVRLKGSFDITRFSNPATRLLLRQMKEYGLILADAGLQWQIATDAAKWPAEVVQAFREIASSVSSSNLEVVDESSLMVSSATGETPLEAEAVIASSTSNPSDRTRIAVALVGPTIGVKYAWETFTAGSPAVQLTYWVNGTSNTNVVWSLDQPVGYISPDGVYTPPATVAASISTVARVTSVVDPTVTALINITVLPAGALRVACGRKLPYTDTRGQIWQPGAGNSQGWMYEHDYGGWPIPDGDLYRMSAENLNDLQYRFHVPNGTYRVTVKLAEPTYTAADQRLETIESQGNVVFANVDIFAQAGGAKKGLDLSFDASVTDGVLSVAARRVKGELVVISGISAVPATSPASTQLSITPAIAGEVLAGAQKQFTAVATNMASTVTWSITPALGSITTTGLYTAPAALPTVATTVTVTAVSTVDPSISAAATLTLPAAPPPSSTGPLTIMAPAGSNRVLPGQTVQFVATSEVVWSISPALGSISASGLYTAPASVTSDAFITLTATNGTEVSKTSFVLSNAIRVNPGSLSFSFTDSQRRIWSADYGFSGSSYIYGIWGTAISGTTTDMYPLYTSSRFSRTNQSFAYNFKVPNGTYRVTLKFAEYRPTSAYLPYLCDIKLNGTVVLSDFNPVSVVGLRAALDKSFSVTVTNGVMQVDFIGKSAANGGVVNGIEILPASPTL